MTIFYKMRHTEIDIQTATMYTYSILVFIALATSTAWGCGDYTSSYKPTSCEDVARRCRSGVYNLADGDAYCDMDSPCGGAGWTKIADVNMGQTSNSVCQDSP